MFVVIFLKLLILNQFVIIIAQNAQTVCPPSTILVGCGCRQTRDLDSLPDIICGNNQSDVLRTIEKINDHYHGQTVHYGRLLWANRIHTNLSQSFFHNVTFREIIIGSGRKISSLEHVHPEAFRGPIADRLKSLQIRSDKLGNDEDLYGAIRTLRNLKTLNIEGRFLQRIPSYAFSSQESEECKLPLLKSISFSQGKYESLIFLTEIQPHGFYNLPSLETLNLFGQDIGYIGDYAFALPKKSETKLTIDLAHQWNRQFTPASFSEHALSQLNRPVELLLNGNFFIKYLPEKIFRTFLDSDSRNRIRLGMKIDCDCRNYWLYFNQDRYEKQFIVWSYNDDDNDDGTSELKSKQSKYRILCQQNNDDLWKMDRSLFENCTNDNDFDQSAMNKMEL